MKWACRCTMKGMITNHSTMLGIVPKTIQSRFIWFVIYGRRCITVILDFTHINWICCLFYVNYHSYSIFVFRISRVSEWQCLFCLGTQHEAYSRWLVKILCLDEKHTNTVCFLSLFSPWSRGKRCLLEQRLHDQH